MALFTNYATLSYNGRTTNSNTVTGEILETLSAQKTAVAASYTVGEDHSYVVTLQNSGSEPLTGLTLTDDLGGYETEGTTVYPLTLRPDSLRLFVDGVLQPAPAFTAGPPLSVTGLSVPAGGNLMLVYETLVTDFAPLAAGSVIENTVTVTGGALVTPVTASAALPVAEAASLAVHKGLSPAAVTAGGTVNYSFTLENSGNTALAAAENAVLTDTFDPILSALKVSFNGTPWTAGVNYSYDQTTGVFTTLPGQLALPAAVFIQNADGSWAVQPGEATLLISGTLTIPT